MILKLFYLIFGLVLLFITRSKSEFTKDCPFEYTVDLTESPLLPNGSYLYHNDTVIPPKYVKSFNYTIQTNESNSPNVRTHKRGCICAVKQCLPICSKKMLSFYNSHKLQSIDNGFTKNVTFSGGIVRKKHLIRDFYPIFGSVCKMKIGYMMSPEIKEHNEWTLFENNTLLRHYDNMTLTITEYCFEILQQNSLFIINPVVCGESLKIPWFKIWAMAFSIPFFIITMICYYYLSISQEEARCKCFITYLSFLTLSYTLICCYTITGIYLTSIPCQIFGFLVYYTVIAYLTWTCILSYDTWKSLTNISQCQPTFATYSFVGFLIPSLMTLLTFFAHISGLPDTLKPGMTVDMCAVNTFRWSALIYYYIPCIIVFVYSLTLYVWIVLFQKKHNEELHTLFRLAPEPLLERFALFFRIFLFMGISWSLDILSYFFRMAFVAKDYFIYDTIDLFNAFHGLFVFLVLICRKSVLKKVRENIRSRTK